MMGNMIKGRGNDDVPSRKPRSIYSDRVVCISPCVCVCCVTLIRSAASPVPAEHVSGCRTSGEQRHLAILRVYQARTGICKTRPDSSK